MSAEIPKRIIQIWGGGRDLPLVGKASSTSVRAINCDFEYMLLDDGAISYLLKSSCVEHRKAFNSFRYEIQKFDFIRYVAIYRFGGFYLDTDVFLVSRLEGLRAFGCVFPFERLTWSDYLRNHYGMDWEIGNYAFGAAPGHPFIGAVIENCVRAQTDHAWRDAMTKSVPWPLREDLFVIYSTGPGLVSRTLAEYRDAENPVEVLWPENVWDKKNCWNRFGDYGIHLGGGSWRPAHSAWRRRLINFFGGRNEARAIGRAQKIGPKRSLQFSKAEARPMQRAPL